MKWLVGIDEAGRGPLAGPVAVGVVKTPGNFDWKSKLPGVTDSKKLTPEKRAAFFRLAKQLKRQGELDFAVAMVGAKYIDEKGIARAIALAMARAIARLKLDPADTFIKLDGSLKAPAEFQQETIIKGDLTELVISLASILAKETRDAYMRRIAAEPQFAAYDFATHKGYGTRAHRHALQQFGISVIHRRSYCKKSFPV